MISDGLTKGLCGRDALQKLGNTGRWNLTHAAIGFSESRHIPIISVAAQMLEMQDPLVVFAYLREHLGISYSLLVADPLEP